MINAMDNRNLGDKWLDKKKHIDSLIEKEDNK